MKKYLVLFCLLLGAGVVQLYGQCSGGTAAGTVSPTASWQTVGVTTGTYKSFTATAGLTYMFSFCQGGGSAGFDSQLTMLNNAGAYAGAYSDDVCGSASELSWNCPTSGTYRILINDYFCMGSGTAATLAYRSFTPGPGSTCGNPHNIAALPFTVAGLSTCGAGNDYTSADACTSIYMDGEDYVFRYVATGAQTLRITLSNTLSFTGVFVVQGCPNSGGTCIAASSSGAGCSSSGATNTSSTGNPVADFALPGAGTYFIIVDTWPSPACTGFDIDVRLAPSSGGGPGCSAYTITTPAYNPDNFNSGTTLTFPDDEFSAAVPLPFTFCFMGTNYNSLVVSSNAYVSFNSACASQYSGWDTDIIPTPANTNSPEARNSIMFPWVDVDPGVGGTIKYNTYGTAPNRRFVVSFRNVAMFSASCNALLYTGQVVLYETSFVIDIYVANLPSCPTWNNGEAVLGLFDATGTVAVPIPGFNNTVYTLSNFARRLTPNCPTCTVPLPVAFADVHGVREGDHNVVSWTTSHEINSASFTVERSRDAQTFEPVGTIAGSGTEPMGKTYAMDDRQAFSPLTYYRIAQTDHNGTVTLSEVITVATVTSNFAIMQVLPQGDLLELNVQNMRANQLVRVELLDVLGKVVHAESAPLEAGLNRLRVDVGALTPGVYFVRVTDAEGTKQVRKFVRN